MGETIQYYLRCEGTESHVIAQLDRLRAFAKQLPVERVSDLYHAEGTGIKTSVGFRELQEAGPLITKLRGAIQIGPNHWDVVYAMPMWAHGFHIDPGPGCESAGFYLASYPKTITHGGKRIRTKLGDAWYGSDYCKTQFASHGEYGGAANRISCHLSVCALLFLAKKLGILLEVNDESDFWTTHLLPSIEDCELEWADIHSLAIPVLQPLWPDVAWRFHDIAARVRREHEPAEANK